MQITFVSNYINHHQIPFSNALYELTGGNYTFVQTEPMEQERVQMGWQTGDRPYVKLFYEEPEYCRELLLKSDVVIFGGVNDDSLADERLEAGKMTFRYSERLYRTGQWKAVSPRGLKKKYHDHTRHRNKPVYLLCAGAYVPSDYHIIRAYKNKMYCFGYFPETRHYDIDELMAGKAGDVPRLLWVGRFLKLKHPELAIENARYLKEKGIAFHLDMVGAGEMEEEIKASIQRYGLEECVSLHGFVSPEAVRTYMERANIFLFTSNRLEGWGAVVNEAMNSGCAVVAGHMIGSVPYLLRTGENGFVYRDGDVGMLLETVEKLVRDPRLCDKTGRAAYETIVSTWNAENAARSLYELIEKLQKSPDVSEVNECPVGGGFAPCMPAPVISERRMFGYLMKKVRKS